jgi:cytochrome P450
MTLPEFPPPRTRPLDPPDILGEMRSGEGIGKVLLWSGRWAWLVTRYEDARFVLADPRFSSDMQNPGLPSLSPGQGFPRHQTAMVRMDNPRHGELRHMVAGEFGRRRAAELRQTIERIVRDQIDVLLDSAPPIDLREMFALPIPARLICELLGLPLTDQDFLQECTRKSKVRTITQEEGAANQLEMYDYCNRLVAEREKDPKDDVIGRLVTREMRAGLLSRDELVTMTKVLITAGHETTANMIGLGALMMLLRSDWFYAMREAPEAVPNIVEELLRYHTIANAVPRVATDDVSVGGITISAGEGVVVSLASANRDEGEFDNSDEFDIYRENARRHLAFGHGAHRCLGLWLARAELQIALPALATRIPTLHLAVPFEQIEFAEDTEAHGVRELPVAW